MSTAVDERLFNDVRKIRVGLTDVALFDEALAALLAAHRATPIDATYSAYDQQPLDQADAWGDLASFLDAPPV